MALRLRRGTDAERQLITPVEGELIYTTDTKLLYVGDGSTAGGTLVTGAGGGGSSTLDGLSDTDLTGAANDDVLTFNGITNKWEAVAVPGVGSVAIDDLSDVLIYDLGFKDVLGYDGLIWRPYRASELIDPGCNLNINIVGDDSTILVNTDNNTFTGDLIGDVTGNILGNVTGDAAGDHTGTFTGVINATGDHTGTFTGFITATGTLDGDIVGSVFADDSTVVIDGITGDVSANDLSIGAGGILFVKDGNSLDISSALNNGRIDIATINTNVFSVVGDLGATEGASLTTSTSRGTAAAPIGLQAGDFSGAVTFSAYKTSLSDYRVNAGILSSVDTVTGTDDIPGKISVALRDPDGDIFFALSVNSRGVTEAPIFKPTAYADTTARDAAITSPEAGMVIFVTDSDGGGTEALQVYKATGGWTTIS